MVRIVGEDHEREGVAMTAGETVFLGVLSANRDELAFADADTLQLDRTNARTHLGYGYGSHFCLGAALARLETEIAVGRLLQRAPHLTLGDERVTWSEVLLGRGPQPAARPGLNAQRTTGRFGTLAPGSGCGRCGTFFTCARTASVMPKPPPHGPELRPTC